MNSFETMGDAILLANEGENQIAYIVIDWVAGLATSLRKALSTKSADITQA